MANQGMGEVISFDRSNLPAVREDYVEAIQLWCETRNTAEVLTREEIGSMQAFDRIDAQRKALILSFAHYLREHPRSDVALGVQLVLTLLSDNEKGISSISQPTLAKLFNRSVSSIADAQRRLKDKGLIVTGRGRYAGTTPVIPRVVTQHKNHLTWLIDAICNQDKTSNHPARPVDCQSSGQTGGLKRIEHQSTGPTGGLKKLNHPVEGNSIIRPDPMQLHYRNSLKEEGAPKRESSLSKVAAAVAAGMAASVPMSAAAHHPPEQVQQIPAECWQNSKAQMAAAMNAMEARAQKQVWMTGTGMLQVAGEFKAELLETYPLVDLVSGLSTACTNVKPERGAIDAMQHIRRQFGYMQQDANRRQAAAQARAASAPPIASSEEARKAKIRRAVL